MENNFHIVVQKFGGSSVAEPDKIKKVARFIKQRLGDNERICVVVSAMGHTTNELIKLAYEVNASPSKRELDMLISCGERSSMALLAMALHGEGISAVSLTGSQSGIITDDNHGGAEIIAIKPERVFQAFDAHQVVIIAGFQGMSRSREITTLKRGGSDTTAVAMAAALMAKSCEIYTDVPGVMDIDPSVKSIAQLIPSLSSEQMCAMSLYGAKVMAYDAARLARSLGVELSIRKSCETSPGTKVREVAIKNSRTGASALTHLRAVMRIEIPIAQCHNFAASNFLCGQLLHGALVAYGSNDIAQEFSGSLARVDKGLALITIHLHDQSDSTDVWQQAIMLLKNNAIEIKDAILGFNRIALIILDDCLIAALESLHSALLGGEKP